MDNQTVLILSSLVLLLLSAVPFVLHAGMFGVIFGFSLVAITFINMLGLFTGDINPSFWVGITIMGAILGFWILWTTPAKISREKRILRGFWAIGIWFAPIVLTILYRNDFAAALMDPANRMPLIVITISLCTTAYWLLTMVSSRTDDLRLGVVLDLTRFCLVAISYFAVLVVALPGQTLVTYPILSIILAIVTLIGTNQFLRQLS